MPWGLKQGVLANAFPIQGVSKNDLLQGAIEGELDVISSSFNIKGGKSPFLNSGIVIDRSFFNFKSKLNYIGPRLVLEDVLIKERADTSFYIGSKEIEKWQYYKGAKNEQRKRRDGQLFKYAEGSMSFPDKLDAPSRTIITSEGGKTASRTTHVVQDNHGLRRLTPIELERLNMFLDNHTYGATHAKRAFFMGNALVVGVIEKIGLSLEKYRYPSFFGCSSFRMVLP